jgi:hypothetical protein
MRDTCGCCCLIPYYLVILPIFGTIKSCVITPIIAPITSLIIIMSSVILLPYDAFKAYSFVFLSPRIGINARILLILILPACILLYIPLILICCVIASVILFFGLIIEPYFNAFTRESESKCCSIFHTVAFRYANSAVIEFWDYAKTGFPKFIDGINDPYYEGHVFDINLIQIFIGLIMGSISLVIDIIPILLIMTLKVVPVTLRIWYMMLTLLGSADFFAIILFVPLVVAAALTPILSILAIPTAIIYTSMINMRSVIIMYSTPSLKQGIIYSFKLYATNIYKVNSWGDDFIGVKMFCSCLSSLNYQSELDQLTRLTTPTSISYSYNSSTPIVPVNTNTNTNYLAIEIVWQNFFTMCEQCGRQALTKQWCTRDDIESSEAYFILGLPSLVFCQTLRRSLSPEHKDKSKGTFVLSDGVVINDSNKPTDYLSSIVYPLFVSLKTDFNELNLTPDEYYFFELWLFTNGNEDKCSLVQCDSIDNNTEEGRKRRSQLMMVITQIAAISIIVSRFPTFKNNFNSVCSRILSSNV